MKKTYTFGGENPFLNEKRTKPYLQYGEGSITVKNGFSAQKLLRGGQLRWAAGKRGVLVV